MHDRGRPPDKRERAAPAQDRAALENDLLGGEINDIVPQAFRSRRAFLVWAVACGFVKPDRLTERIVDDLEREARHA